MKRSPDEILSLLESDDSRERVVALVLIGRRRFLHVVEHVEAVMLFDQDNEVRSMAAWTLDVLGVPDSVPSLIQALHDPSFGVRSNAGWALVHLAQRLMFNLVVPDVIEVLEK